MRILLKFFGRQKNAGGMLPSSTGYSTIRKSKRSPKAYLENKEPTRRLILDRLEYFNQSYGFTWGRVAIKNTRRRWGSCSKKGNLNFNYKVGLLASDLADYIVVHELCHLGQFNHSKDFWALVAKTIPNYASIRKNLKDVRL